MQLLPVLSSIVTELVGSGMSTALSDEARVTVNVSSLSMMASECTVMFAHNTCSERESGKKLKDRESKSS